MNFNGISHAYKKKNPSLFLHPTLTARPFGETESRHNTPLRSPPVAQCDEALRNSSSLSLLGPAPPPGSAGLACEAHGGHYSHHGGALTPSPLTSVKSTWQRQPQQWALTVDQVREKVGTPCSFLCSRFDVETALEWLMFCLLLRQQSTSYAFFVHATVYV